VDEVTPKETEWQRRKRRERERAEHVALHGGGCEICGAVPKRGGLHEDHDHKTGEHRGWLCHRCNRVMWRGIDAEWCMRAAAYLNTPPEQRRRAA
jgi:NAD-dependent dihydropyrimidine dehydrogenase PreA subunit